MAANESTKYTNFSNVAVGTASGGGALKVAGTVLPYNVTISYAASATTDGIEATFTVVDSNGDTIEEDIVLEAWISDQADGIDLTSTSASGALTAVAGSIHTALTAKKHWIGVAESGVMTVKLVDSANTADERFCVKHPVTNRIIVGDATVAGDYEGGA